MRNLRSALLTGAALVALDGVNQAQAQVQAPGWFGSITGWYVVDSGNDKTGFTVSGGRTTTDDGAAGAAYIGYRFAGGWDVAFGAKAGFLSDGNSAFAGGGPGGVFHMDGWMAAGDGELGYTFADLAARFGIRPFVGVRVAGWHHDYDQSTGFSGDVRSWGVGPRIGLDATVKLGQSISLFGGASGSVLFGKIRDRGPGLAFVWQNDNSSRTFWNAEGKVGLAFDIAPMVALAVGYTAEYWNGVANAIHYNDGGTVIVGGRADRFMHGPFARVSYNIGAPGAAPVAAVAPAPTAVMTKNFIVFFDHDRSNLTGQAQATIREAAAASKTGGVQRINVTGHADKSGADQYNMALSLRRANTVKDDLVRNGVPAGSIVVVGRGESQPLVPTADGVKEPQNRRVEIVLN